MSSSSIMSNDTSLFGFSRLTDQETFKHTDAESLIVHTAEAPPESEGSLEGAHPHLKVLLHYLKPGDFSPLLGGPAPKRFGHTITVKRKVTESTVMTTQFQVWVDPDLGEKGLPIVWGEIIQMYPSLNVEVKAEREFFASRHPDGPPELAAIDINERMKSNYCLDVLEDATLFGWSEEDSAPCEEFLAKYFNEASQWYRGLLGVQEETE